MAATTQKRDDRSTSKSSGSRIGSPSPERANPGCSILFLSGIILLIVSLGIVGLLFLLGVDLHGRFWAVFFIFACAGAFMYQLAKIIQKMLVEKKE
ncbi:MAG: hypothetical protein RDU20_14140 [Desulfomonilaceae bacterium]|nr:hypothetical protein [Desulfomonilaceae bacterium]